MPSGIGPAADAGFALRCYVEEKLLLGSDASFGQDDHSWLSPLRRPDASSEQFRALGGTGMSIELIVVIVVVLFAVGIAAGRKRRTGSFAPWWWRGKDSRGE
jgi:hypothetical protein